MINSLIVFFIFTTSVEFFLLNIFSDDFNRYSQLVALVLMVFSIVFESIKSKNIDIKKLEFSKGILILLSGVLLSSISAWLFFKQPLSITLVTQRYLYFYLFYYFLHFSKFNIEILKKIILLFAFVFAVIFYYLYLTLDNSIVNTNFLVERGTVRISLPGIFFIEVALFYFLQQMIRLKKIEYLFLVVIFLLINILTGTRLIIFTVLFVIFLSLKNSFKNYSKFRTSLSVFIVITLGIIFFTIIEQVFMLLIYDVTNNTGNYAIRIESIRFYFSNLFPSIFTYILGNGLASELTNYGQEIFYYKKQYGLYQSDIGLFGEYVRFGILFIAGVVILVIKMLKNKSNDYITYSFYFIIISSVFLSNFGVLSCIPLLCSLFFIEEKINSIIVKND